MVAGNTSIVIIGNRNRKYLRTTDPGILLAMIDFQSSNRVKIFTKEISEAKLTKKLTASVRSSPASSRLGNPQCPVLAKRRILSFTAARGDIFGIRNWRLIRLGR